ncbi:MAG: CehA/McbA family metallohydrolase [Gemmataceae bacterium]|nr:CehA/McbA family metallohydrolase [Gemmataceae bacterium]
MKRLLAVLSIGLMIALAVLATGGGPEPAKNSKPIFAVGAIHPCVAPDGKAIAFSYQGAIWTVPAAGGTMTRLTDGEGFDHEPAWSPDGTRIAFVRGPNALGGDLRLIHATDGKDILLKQPVQVRGSYNFQKIFFHPDGKRLLSVFRAGGKDFGLSWYDLETGDVKSLSSGLSSMSRYALSPDGKLIAFTKLMDQPGQQSGNDGPQARLFELGTDGGAEKEVGAFPSRVHDLCFDTSGKNLILVSELGGAHYDLWHVPRHDMNGMKKWTFGQADEDRPSLSRDGKTLVYTDNRQGATALMVRDLSTGKEHAVGIDRMDFRRSTGTLRLATHDRDGKKPLVARISLLQDKGKFHAPPGSLYRMLRGVGHFYCDKSAEFELPTGTYRLRAFRGPEYKAVTRELTIEAGRTLDLNVALERWTHAAKSGWISGENHIHANYGYGQWYNTPESMLLQCGGEDLRICNLVVANSDTDGIFDRAFFRGRPDPLSTTDTLLYWNQEFRSTLWGHMTLVNLRQVVEPVMTGFKDTTNPWDVPTNADVADRTHWQKGHVNYTHPVQNPVKPFENPYAAKGLPIDVALGKIDSLDLNNAYAGTVPIWYRLLHCGFRLPPSAGTDVFLNRIFSNLPGGDRVYVHVGGVKADKDGLYADWIDGLKKGRSFVSNGPMLEFTVDGKSVGEVVKIAAPKSLKARIRVDSHLPLDKAELIVNGKVAPMPPWPKNSVSGVMEMDVDVMQSGWIALRASGPGHPDSPLPALYAHTAPIYVEVASVPTRSRADALFFLNWIDELSVIVRTRDRVPNDELRKHVQGQMEAARAVYARIAKEAE